MKIHKTANACQSQNSTSMLAWLRSPEIEAIVDDLHILHLQDRSCLYETVCASTTPEMVSRGTAEPHDFLAAFVFGSQIARVLTPRPLLDREMAHADALLNPEICCREVPHSAKSKSAAHPDGRRCIGLQGDPHLPSEIGETSLQPQALLCSADHSRQLTFPTGKAYDRDRAAPTLQEVWSQDDSPTGGGLPCAVASRMVRIDENREFSTQGLPGEATDQPGKLQEIPTYAL